MESKSLCFEGTNLRKLGVNTCLCLMIAMFIVGSGLIGYFSIVINYDMSWETEWFEIVFTSISYGMSMITFAVSGAMFMLLIVYGLPYNYYCLVKRSIDEILEYFDDKPKYLPNIEQIC